MSPALLEILRTLSSESFTSGELIARSVGCSRATVHKSLQEAANLGVEVHAIRGRGYRLAEHFSWLDQSRLSQAVRRQGMQFHFFEEQASTNEFLLGLAAEGGAHRSLVVAEFQTRGRGRRGRSWLSGLGGGIAFSFLWRSTRTAAELSGLSLAVGMVLTKALHQMGLTGAMVKWPNDIVVDEEKLAGVLIELSGDMLGPTVAVIGVGINVLGGSQLSQKVGQPVTDLARHLGRVNRNEVLLSLVNALDKGLQLFEAEGFAPFHADWGSYHAYRGRMVNISCRPGEVITGRELGINAEGALMLETSTGTRCFHSGEVSLRGADS